MRFLEIVQIYETKWSEKIKKEKFRLYNNDLINKIKDVQNKFQLMSDYLQQGGFFDDGGDEYMGGEDDGDIYMDEKGYLSKYPYY